MTITVLTKKQKKLMKDRRRKKRLYEETNAPDTGNKAHSKKNDESPTHCRDSNKSVSKEEDPGSSVAAFPKGPRPESNNGVTPNQQRKRPRISSKDDEEPDHLNDKTIDSTRTMTTTISSNVDATNIQNKAKKNRILVIVPADLDHKGARKYRKDARRAARADGQDESQLRFVVERKHKKLPPSKNNKPSICINDLVVREKKDRERRALEDSRQEEEAALTDEYKQRYVAVDCEMVGVGADGKKSALARVSLVDWNGATLLDTFVKVPSRVTDFRTHVSGVQSKHLKADTAMDERTCRETVAALLQNKILVGHALKNDLDALMLQHPKDDIRDTAKFRPYQRYGGRKWRARKLRDLAKEHVGLLIQQEGQAHDSVEDAKAAMQLFKLKRKEWEAELDQKKDSRKGKK